MAIADTINLMKTNITNAYNAIQTKGGTVPTNKNLENLSAAINSIEAGGGIEDVATVAALKAKCTADNAGKVYRYTGTTSGNYIKGALYVVHYDDTTANYGGVSYVLFDLGLEIYKLQTAPYTITYNLTHCDITSGDSTNTMDLCGSKKIIIAATADYIMPESITVAGCSYNYTRINNNYNAILELYNPTGNITVTIAAEMGLTANAATIMKMFNQDLMMGPAMDISKATEFANEYTALNGSDQKYFTDFYNMMTKTALPLMQQGTQAAYDTVNDLIAKDTYWEKCNWLVETVKVNSGKGLDIVLKSPKYDFYWNTADLNN